jgi:hypothetical protein
LNYMYKISRCRVMPRQAAHMIGNFRRAAASLTGQI